jgi:ribosomal-protein-alanine N-acetyltransferase
MLAAGSEDAWDQFLVCRASDEAIVGAVSVSGLERGAFHSAHLGWWVGAAHVRRGYTTEAVALLVDHCFRRLRLHRVEANIRPENVPSIRLARRVGFRREGLAKRFLEIDGAWRDHERWAITVEEWGGPLRRSRAREPARGG